MPEQTSEPETVAWECGDMIHRKVVPCCDNCKSLIRRADAEEYYGSGTFSIGHWMDIGRREKEQEIIEMLEERREKVEENDMKDEGGDEHYAGQRYALKKLKQKLKGENDA